MYYDVSNTIALSLADTYYDMPLGTPFITDDVSYNSTSIIVTNEIGRSLATFDVKTKISASASSTQTLICSLKRTRASISTYFELDIRTAKILNGTTTSVVFGTLALPIGFIQDNPLQPLDLAVGDEIEFSIKSATGDFFISL